MYNYNITEPLKNRILKNNKLLKSFLKQHNITCYRIFDWDMPEFPLCIDVYEKNIHISEYKTKHNIKIDEHETWQYQCIETIKEIFNCSDEHIFLKTRHRQNSTEKYGKVNDEKNKHIVHEHGMQFIVNLSDYLDTGLFLDHRNTRLAAKQQAKDKHVLNLFSYTGAFTVYMACGGAASTTTVDLNTTYLNWAKENMKLNGQQGPQHEYIKTDVKEWIVKGPKKKYDIIILDPPTLSISEQSKTKFDVQNDHVHLINNCLLHMNEGGILYFSNNYRNFVLDKKNITSNNITNITHLSIPQDFRNKKIHQCFKIMKD